MYGGVEICLLHFLISALDSGEWSALTVSSSWKEAPSIYWITACKAFDDAFIEASDRLGY